MPTKGRKVKYYQYTGQYSKIPDPRGTGGTVPGEPIFKAYDGYVRGPFEVIRPARFKKLPGGDVEVIEEAELKFMPNIYTITVPNGGAHINKVFETWHLDVNFGTEYNERWGHIENARQKKDSKLECSYFEFADEPAIESSGMESVGSEAGIKKRK